MKIPVQMHAPAKVVSKKNLYFMSRELSRRKIGDII